MDNYDHRYECIYMERLLMIEVVSKIGLRVCVFVGVARIFLRRYFGVSLHIAPNYLNVVS